jgi:hypothetical protein
VIFSGIVCVFSRLHLYLVELSTCLVAYNDLQWNYVRLQQFIMIVVGFVCVFSSL